MKSKVYKDEVIKGANHQINTYFVTKQEITHLVNIFTLNLFNDKHAKERFEAVVKSFQTKEDGQYYLELISNLSKPGIILDSTKMLTFECYKEIINSIIFNSNEYVKNVFKW